MKFDDEICKGVSCPECSFNKGEDGCLLTKRLDEIEIIPEPCEDAISRQAVLDLIADYDLSMGQVVKGIHALPPVTSQPKIGHWIYRIYGGFHEEGNWHCSRCDYIFNGGYGHAKHCPECGCKMSEAPTEEVISEYDK